MGLDLKGFERITLWAPLLFRGAFVWRWDGRRRCLALGLGGRFETSGVHKVFVLIVGLRPRRLEYGVETREVPSE